MKLMPRSIKKHFYVVTYTINLIMIPVFLVCGITGILLFPGFLDWCGISMRRFPMDTVVFLHDWSGLALVAGVVLHLLLHLEPTWQFVKVKVLRRSNKAHGKPKHQEDTPVAETT